MIADPDGLARSMMHTAVLELDRVAMVTAAGDGHDALDLARHYQPDVLVVDTGLPPDGAVELVRKVAGASPLTRIITVSVDDAEGAVAALRAGAVGHISKEVNPEKLAELVIRAADGEVIVPRSLVSELLAIVRETPEAGWRPVRSRLTTREWEIVEHLAQGASTHLIAERLVLSPTTIYSHVKSLMRKLEVHSRREAVRAAERLRREEAVGEKSPQLLASKFTVAA